MKRLMLFLFFSVSFSGDLFAPCFSISRYDYSTNSTQYCGSLWPNSRNTIAHGGIVFDSFPNVATCSRSNSSSSWSVRSPNGLCAGLSLPADGVNRTRIDPVANKTNACWDWQCKSGYEKGPGGICWTLDERCASAGLVPNSARTGCTTNWCSGFTTGYNASQHDEVKSGSCVKYKCKVGTWFTDANATTCKVCNPKQGTIGGCIYRGEKTDKPYYHDCTATEYSDGTSGTWNCTTIPNVMDDAIKKCWKCPDRARVLTCLSSGVAC